MEDSEQKAVKNCMPKLINDLEFEPVIIYLRALQVLTADDLERIKRKGSPSESRLELLSIIQRRDNAWEHLLNALVASNQGYLGMKSYNICVIIML